MAKKAVHQFVATLSPHDAIGNEVLLMQDELRSLGYESNIYCDHSNIPGRATLSKNIAATELDQVSVILHFSVALHGLLRFLVLPKNLILRYHNITPEFFFDPIYEGGARSACHLGRQQLRVLCKIAHKAWAASHYSADELSHYGSPKTDVLPLLKNYGIISSKVPTKSPRQTLLFVGRLVPNKKQQDLIQMLALYRASYNVSPQLVLVGKPFSQEYGEKLVIFAKSCGLAVSFTKEEAADVVFLHHVSDDQLNDLYGQADAFICMSEHEGFCVPIVEAMHHGLPILAHPSSAVGETLGDGGLLADKNDYLKFLAYMHDILHKENLRADLYRKAQARAQHFGYERTKSTFLKFVTQDLEIAIG
jgi:glycosyltransferase involved in cell wall biosynthesis